MNEGAFDGIDRCLSESTADVAQSRIAIDFAEKITPQLILVGQDASVNSTWVADSLALRPLPA
jgi:hypothetical protein